MGEGIFPWWDYYQRVVVMAEEQMPTSLELQQAFAGKGVNLTLTNMVALLRDQERSGRMERDVQVQDNCTVQMVIDCDFAEAEEGVLVSDWLEFGEMRFVQEPAFTTGSRRIPLESETAMDAEMTNYDPVEHFSVPGVAMVLGYRMDDRGFYSAAKCLFFALASVPTEYKVRISAVWTGPAIRKG